MSTLKITAAAITLALIVPGVALAKGAGPDGAKGKAGAPGQVCKSLKVRGEKTPEQRAAYKACIKDAAAERKAGKGKAGAPGQVCKSLKVRGKKTAEQRAAYKACIRDAVAERKAAAERQAVAKRDAARADRDGEAGDIPDDGDEDADKVMAR